MSNDSGGVCMKIKYILDGREVEVDADEGHTLLDTALIAKLAAPYSCMEGSCGTCEAVIEEGRTSEDQENTQIVRTCQALPRSEYVVVNYDKGPLKKICN
jgi:ferredoxin